MLLLPGSNRGLERRDMATTPKPVRIGYCLSLTGPVAGNSRSARLAHDIWREDVNRRGGLLGRPVELICYDDRTDASLVPGIYTRLMDEDQVDLVIGGYGANGQSHGSCRFSFKEYPAMRLANSGMGRGKSWCHRQTSPPEGFVFLMPKLSPPSQWLKRHRRALRLGGREERREPRCEAGLGAKA
jgi:hypothetical protein